MRLEQKLAGNPNKKLLMAAIAKKRTGQFDSFFDHLHTEMIITGDTSQPVQTRPKDVPAKHQVAQSLESDS